MIDPKMTIRNHDGTARALRLRSLLALALFVYGAGGAYADHPSVSVGAGAATSINTESAIQLGRGRWAAALRSELVDFRELSDARLDGIADRDPDADVHSVDTLWALSLGAFYGVTDDLTLGVRLPYIRRSRIREPGHHAGGTAVAAPHTVGRSTGSGDGDGTIERLGDADDIGDLSLLAQYRLWHRGPSHGALIAGLETPTGGTSERSRAGERLEAEFQPGSGSWDVILGAVYTHVLGPVTLDVSGVYTINTEGTQDVDLGDVLSYNLAASYRLHGRGDGHHHEHAHPTPHRLSLAWDAVLELNGEWRDLESENGHRDASSGGSVVYLSPGTMVGIGDHLSLGLSVGIPIIVDLDRSEVAPDYRMVFTTAWAF